MYAVLAGELPFDQNILSQQIREADVQFHGVVWSTISAEAKDLISKLIVKDPAKRLTVAQALKHPWIENVWALAWLKHRSQSRRLPRR